MPQLITLLAVFERRVESSGPDAEAIHDRFKIVKPDVYLGKTLVVTWRPRAPVPAGEIDGKQVKIMSYRVADPGAYRSPVWVNILEAAA